METHARRTERVREERRQSERSTCVPSSAVSEPWLLLRDWAMSALFHAHLPARMRDTVLAPIFPVAKTIFRARPPAQEGLVRYLFATETFAMGLNMPVRVPLTDPIAACLSFGRRASLLVLTRRVCERMPHNSCYQQVSSNALWSS
eukprot:1467879-Pleurochrysis_carterae.AAC.1